MDKTKKQIGKTPNFTLTPKIKPTLYDINKSFEIIKFDKYDGIKGEEAARLCVFTNFILGRKPMLLSGSRASGKTNLMAITGTYSPNPIKIANASDKADIRDSKNIGEASHLIIPEINKASKNFIEMLKDFGEGVEYTYKTLDEWKMPLIFKIPPKAFISSIADENNSSVLGEEITSRITTISLDTSTEQNIRVIDDKLERAQNPYKKRAMTQENVKRLQFYVHSLPPIDDFKFIYLPGKSLRKAIPPRFTDSRRDVEKYLHNTYGIALFHLHDRMVFGGGKKENKSVLITPEDAWYNHRIYGEILIQSALKCGKIELMIIKILRKYAEAKPLYSEMNMQQIYEAILTNGITPTTNTITKMCDDLFKNGIIVKNIDKKPATYQTSTFFKDFDADINWNDVVEECKASVQKLFPEQAKEYIQRFCGEEIIVVDPFSGEKVNILDTKTNKKKDSINLTIDKNSLSDFLHKPKLEEERMVIEEEVVDEDDKTNDNEDIDKCRNIFSKEGNSILMDDLEKVFTLKQIKKLILCGEIIEDRENASYKKLL